MLEISQDSRDGDTEKDTVKLIAFYLPQFHPIPENDKWWGKGFTEWTNVTKARPQFLGHYQPRLPADLGFYDLRLREIRHQQIALAKKYGIYGFCYHYYWFSGTRLLERPVDDMLADAESDMPFCLCWANENWTRRWDAKEHEILIAQKYAPGDDQNFIRGIIPFFRDPRYIRLNGAPLLIVYRPKQLPDSKRSTQIWREVCESAGIPDIHLCTALTHGNEEYQKYGFDSGVQFPPHNLTARSSNSEVDFLHKFRGSVIDYYEIATEYLKKEYRRDRVFKTVSPSWDNTARRDDRAAIVLNGTPENYEYWLSEAIKMTRANFQDSDRLVFINAWNEWAEGCYLEPDRKFGNAFLESTLRAKTGKSTLSEFKHKGSPAQFSNGGKRRLVSDLGEVIDFHFSSVLNFLFNGIRILLNKNPRLKQSMLPLIRLGRMIFQR